MHPPPRPPPCLVAVASVPGLSVEGILRRDAGGLSSCPGNTAAKSDTGRLQSPADDGEGGKVSLSDNGQRLHISLIPQRVGKGLWGGLGGAGVRRGCGGGGGEEGGEEEGGSTCMT